MNEIKRKTLSEKKRPGRNLSQFSPSQIYFFSAGAFMGFDSELEDSGSECDIEGQKANIAAHNLRAAAKPVNFVDPTDHLPIFEDQLLDGLQLWLDRLFEGSTYRYHINYWPEFPISPANFHTRQVQG